MTFIAPSNDIATGYKLLCTGFYASLSCSYGLVLVKS